MRKLRICTWRRGSAKGRRHPAFGAEVATLGSRFCIPRWCLRCCGVTHVAPRSRRGHCGYVKAEGQFYSPIQKVYKLPNQSATKTPRVWRWYKMEGVLGNYTGNLFISIWYLVKITIIGVNMVWFGLGANHNVCWTVTGHEGLLVGAPSFLQCGVCFGPHVSRWGLRPFFQTLIGSVWKYGWSFFCYCCFRGCVVKLWSLGRVDLGCRKRSLNMNVVLIFFFW